MLNTYVVYVENKPGVLTRVASLFRRRAFNIDSLTVGRTEKPEVSRMTITAEADHDQARRINLSRSLGNLDLRALHIAKLCPVIGRRAMPGEIDIIVETSLRITQRDTG